MGKLLIFSLIVFLLAILAVLVAFYFGWIKIPSNLTNTTTSIAGILPIDSTSLILTSPDPSVNYSYYDANGVQIPLSNPSYNRLMREQYGNQIYVLAQESGHYGKVLQTNVMDENSQKNEVKLDFGSLQAFPRRINVFPASYSVKKDNLQEFLIKLENYPGEYFGNLQFSNNQAICLLYNEGFFNIQFFQTGNSGKESLQSIDLNFVPKNFQNKTCAEFSFQEWYSKNLGINYYSPQADLNAGLIFFDKEYYLDSNDSQIVLKWGFIKENSLEDVGASNQEWVGSIQNQ